MKRISIAALVGTAGFLASGLSSAQAPMTMPSTPMAAASQGQMNQSPSPSAVYVPSDIAVLSSGTPDGNRLRKGNGGIGLVHSSPGTGRASAEVEPNIPRICFQPGIGWTLIPAGSIASPDSTKRDENTRGANAGLQIHRRISSSREALNCPTTPIFQGGTQGTNTDGSSEDAGLDFMKPLFTSGSDLNQYDIFQALLPDHPGSGTGVSNGYKSAFDLPSGLKAGRNLNPAGATYSVDELKGLKNRAYISPVTLRRLSRNPQNVETRLELRQLGTEVEKRNKSERWRKNQNAVAAEKNAAGNKHTNSRDLLAKKAECDKKADASKSKVCSLLKKVR